MLVSLNWITEFIRTGLNAEETSHRLTMAGLEIEGMENASGEDHVLEVNVTPNRSDSLSVLGIARELSAITGAKLTLPPHDVPKDMQQDMVKQEDSDFTIEILDKELCPRYAGRIIKGVKIAESPAWIKEKLEKCGIRSINNVVDITNYVLLEFGHPLHAFDLATLQGKKIRVGVAGSGIKFRTLDDLQREMPEETLMIFDADRPVAVAGVMGGAETEVSDSTTDVFLESAYFNPASIRRTSKLLGLSTEASYRFERGTDIIMLEHAMDRAARLMAEVAGGTVLDKMDQWPGDVQFPTVKARPDRINKVLGTEIPRQNMVDMLKHLGLEVSDEGEAITINPPTFRPDITMEADIIEEIARMYGYDKIPTVVPVAEIKPTESKPSPHLAALKNTLTASGFNEAVNYSFMNINALDTLGIREDDERRKCVRVLNPLRNEDAHMRTTLLPSLLDNLAYNISHGAAEVRLFETSKVFIDEGGELPREPMRLAAVFLARSGPSLYPDQSDMFFRIKGAVESLLGALKLTNVAYGPTDEPFLHPGKGADIFAGGVKAGFLGVLSPVVLERASIKTKHEVAVFELDLDALNAALPGTPEYSSIPRFPAVERDMAILLDRSVSSAEVLESIRSNATGFMEMASVFDVYEGKSVPEGKKSLAFNIRYRSAEKTLTDEEVDTTHEAMVKAVLEKTGGTLRS